MVIFGLVWVMFGHYFGVKWPWITCWFCGLMWRYGHFGHFIFTYLKNIYVCIQVYVAPIRASEGWKKMTKMTKARKTLSFQHVIMVMCVTNIWPSHDHDYILPGRRVDNLQASTMRPQNAWPKWPCRQLNVYLVYVNMLTLVYIQISLHLSTLTDCIRGVWALGKAGNRGQGLHKLFFILKMCYKRFYVWKLAIRAS